MTMQRTAKYLASRGRGPDTMLVHMTPREVAGLESLAQRHYGQGLTTNPDTGLPEAGILQNLLPALAGAGLAMAGMPPMLAAGLIGGGTALASGSLQKGLLAGLGAFGGAGLGSSLGTSAAASTAATAPAAQSVGSFGDMTGMQGMETVSPGFDGYGMENMETVSPGFEGYGTVTPSPDLTTGDFARMDRATLPVEQPGGLAALADKSNMKNWAMAAAPMMMGEEEEVPEAEDNAMIRPYDYDPNVPGGMGYTARPHQKAKDFKGFKEGGSTSLPVRYTYDPDVPGGMGYSKVNPLPDPAPAGGGGGGGGGGAGGASGPVYIPASRFRGGYGNDALPAWMTPGFEMGMGYADGGIVGLLTKGDGDGVSDSIPTTIEHQAPAALANEEYVMPARAVSALGNGSSSAGAKRLDQLVQRVMRADAKANSRKKVAVDIKPDRLLAV